MENLVLLHKDIYKILYTDTPESIGLETADIICEI